MDIRAPRRSPGRARVAVIAVIAVATTALGAAIALRTPAPAHPTALFLGDSYTLGEGLPIEERSAAWASRVADAVGWEAVIAGCTGSGFVRAGLLCNGSYADRVPTLAPEADIVVVQGGINDVGSTAEQITAGVEATFDALAERYPQARLIAVSAFAYEEPPAAELAHVNAAVRAAVESRGGVFLDVGEPLAGRADVLLPDGLHPNAAGHAAIAVDVLAALDDAGYSPG